MQLNAISVKIKFVRLQMYVQSKCSLNMQSPPINWKESSFELKYCKL